MASQVEGEWPGCLCERRTVFGAGQCRSLAGVEGWEGRAVENKVGFENQAK